MAQSRDEKLLFRSLDERSQRLLEVLSDYEYGELRLTSELVAALQAERLTLLAFACLGTKTHCEEVIIQVNRTILFARYFKRAAQLLTSLREVDAETTLQVFLPDLEPRRTWGWMTPQDDITLACLVMRDEAQLPPGWTLHLWSEAEAEFAGTEDETWAAAARDAAEFTRPQILDEETKFFRELGSRHPDILIHGRPREIALKQLGAYAHEGRVLERLFPTGCLVQADVPRDRRDLMFQALRQKRLPILHSLTSE